MREGCFVTLQKNYRHNLKDPAYGVLFQMHLVEFHQIVRDAEVAACIAPVVQKHGPNVARIACDLKPL
jgi:hypothetical protein